MLNEFKFEVCWGDTDAAGIVFYPNFYKWMDNASHAYLSAIGYPSSKLFAELHIGIPLLETHCTFKSPLMFEDKVTIQSSIIELHNKVFKIKHIFVREDQIVAEGYEVRAWTSFNDKPKAQPIPDYIRIKMSPTIEVVDG